MFFVNHTNGCMDYSHPEHPDYDVCSAFVGVKVIRSLERTDVADSLLVEVNDHNHRTYSFELAVDELCKKDSILLKLSQRGIVMHEFYKPFASVYLVEQYKQCCATRAIEYRHKRLGWFEDSNGKHVFLGERTPVYNTHSLCSRKEFRFSCGNRAYYESFLSSIVYKYDTLSLAMAIGYSAVVSSRLKDERDIGTIIVNLCGASSTGKTTVSQLLVSPFASPLISNKEGLIRTFHSTANALYSAIDGINGMPIVLDDITTNPNIQINNLIYTLASGEEKARCDSDGSLKSTGDGWSGVIVISSETSILEGTTQNQGLKARVLQTQGITWTPDAKTAELIKSTVGKHFGFTGQDFADFVAAIPTDDLCTRFDEAQAKVHSLMSFRDNLSDRLESKYTVIALTIELMNECFSLSLDCDTLMKLFLAPEQADVPERNIATKALECVKTFIAQKQAHFHRTVLYNNAPTYNNASGDSYGSIFERPNKIFDVYIHSSKVAELLKSEGINELCTVRKRWKESGITVCDNGRYDCKHGGVRCLHFVFRDTTDIPAPQPEVRRIASQRETPIDTTDWNDDGALQAFYDGGTE